MAQKRQSKEEKKQVNQLRRRRIITLAACLLSVYFLVSIISTQINIYKKRQELGELDAQIEEQQMQNDEIARIIDSGEENLYIERLAREKLGYAAIDERVYIDASGS